MRPGEPASSTRASASRRRVELRRRRSRRTVRSPSPRPSGSCRRHPAGRWPRRGTGSRRSSARCSSRRTRGRGRWRSPSGGPRVEGPLTAGPVLDLVSEDDAVELTALLVANRAFLAPWEPLRDEEYFTEAAQRREIARVLDAHAGGTALPCVIRRDGAIVGRITLSNVVRGPFLSADLGYWVAEGHNGPASRPRPSRRRWAGRSASSACTGSRPEPWCTTTVPSECSSATASSGSGWPSGTCASPAGGRTTCCSSGWRIDPRHRSESAGVGPSVTRFRFVVLGDSIAYGTGARHPDDALGPRLAAVLTDDGLRRRPARRSPSPARSPPTCPRRCAAPSRCVADLALVRDRRERPRPLRARRGRGRRPRPRGLRAARAAAPTSSWCRRRTCRRSRSCRRRSARPCGPPAPCSSSGRRGPPRPRAPPSPHIAGADRRRLRRGPGAVLRRPVPPVLGRLPAHRRGAGPARVRHRRPRRGTATRRLTQGTTAGRKRAVSGSTNRVSTGPLTASRST